MERALNKNQEKIRVLKLLVDELQAELTEAKMDIAAFLYDQEDEQRGPHGAVEL